jgi:hypothetical protein
MKKISPFERTSDVGEFLEKKIISPIKQLNSYRLLRCTVQRGFGAV